VTVRWLIDRASSPKERVARAVALLADDYEERRKAENSMAAAMRALGREPKVPVPPAMTAAARKAELEAQRIADGLAAYQLPPYTRVLETHGLPGGDRSVGDHRVLTGHPHGLRWRLLLNPSEDAGPTGGPSLRRVMTPSDPLAVRMTRLGMAYVETAMAEAEAYVSASVGPSRLAATGGGTASSGPEPGR